MIIVSPMRGGGFYWIATPPPYTFCPNNIIGKGDTIDEALERAWHYWPHMPALIYTRRP